MTSIPNKEVQQIYLGSVNQIQEHGKLLLDKLKDWKPNTQGLVRSKQKGNALLTTQKKVALAKKKSATLTFIKSSTKRVGKGRNQSYPKVAKFVLNMVSNRWETGNPITFDELYLVTSKQFDNGEETQVFRNIYLGHAKRKAFSTWVGRVLHRAGWVLRKKNCFSKGP